MLILIIILITNCIKFALPNNLCVTLGNDCLTDDDCCSNDCMLTIGEASKRCFQKVDNFWGEPEVMALMSGDREPCVYSGHFCIADDDCCSGICKDLVGIGKLHYCDWKDPNVAPKKNHHSTTSFSSKTSGAATAEKPKQRCALNGERCFTNDACCSRKCFYYPGDFKNVCMPEE